MLIVKIELDSSESTEKIDSFSQGHITLSNGDITLSSKTKDRNYSMMIFISLSELVNDIRRFLTDKNQIEYNFVGADSSFQFYLSKNKELIRLTSVGGDLIDEMPEHKIIEAFWNGVKIFMLKYGSCLDKDEMIYDDLKSSILDFEVEFSIDSEPLM
jgi:hypothetical protein